MLIGGVYALFGAELADWFVNWYSHKEAVIAMSSWQGGSTVPAKMKRVKRMRLLRTVLVGCYLIANIVTYANEQLSKDMDEYSSTSHIAHGFGLLYGSLVGYVVRHISNALRLLSLKSRFTKWQLKNDINLHLGAQGWWRRTYHARG